MKAKLETYPGFFRIAEKSFPYEALVDATAVTAIEVKDSSAYPEGANDAHGWYVDIKVGTNGQGYRSTRVAEQHEANDLANAMMKEVAQARASAARTR